MHSNDGAGLTNHGDPNQTAKELSKLSLHCLHRPFHPNIHNFYGMYSRTSVARTLMACLLRLCRTRSRLPWKNPIAADWDNLGYFFFYIENGILCVLIRIIAAMRQF